MKFSNKSMIPSCFFHMADKNYHGEGYKFADFARCVLKNEDTKGAE